MSCQPWWVAGEATALRRRLWPREEHRAPRRSLSKKPAIGATRIVSTRDPPQLRDVSIRAPVRCSSWNHPSARLFCSKQRRKVRSISGRGREQDQATVADGQDHEVRYEADKKGASKDAVKDAIEETGNSRDKVEKELGKKH